MVKVNKELRDEIFSIIEKQLNSNDPPETKITYNRLLNLGYSEFQVKQFIGQCLAVEIFEVLKHQKPYNEGRYVKNLKQLPKEPFD